VSPSQDSEAPKWRKSTRSGGSNCVEVAAVGDGFAVRDSKRPSGSVLTYSSEQWRAFIAGAKMGDFDLPEPSKLNLPTGSDA
jgi:hypothetical protein